MSKAKFTLERLSSREGNGFELYIEMPGSDTRRLEQIITIIKVDGHYIVSDGSRPIAVKHELTSALESAYNQIMSSLGRHMHKEDLFEDLTKYTPPNRIPIIPAIHAAETTVSLSPYRELAPTL